MDDIYLHQMFVKIFRNKFHVDIKNGIHTNINGLSTLLYYIGNFYLYAMCNNSSLILNLYLHKKISKILTQKVAKSIITDINETNIEIALQSIFHETYLRLIDKTFDCKEDTILMLLSLNHNQEKSYQLH
jgi:hypothetical protein